MGLPDDLLEQADALARLDDKGKPKQANIRRAISSAYYALFHLLIESTVNVLLPSRAQALRDQLSRSFEHRNMLQAAKTFAGAGANSKDPWLVALKPATPSADLKDVARQFADLQEARHKADYAVGERFRRSFALSLIVMTRLAFKKWRVIATTPEGEAFMLALLVKSRS